MLSVAARSNNNIKYFSYLICERHD